MMIFVFNSFPPVKTVLNFKIKALPRPLFLSYTPCFFPSIHLHEKQKNDMNNNFFFCNDKAAAIMAAVKNPILSKAFCNTVDLLPLRLHIRYCKLTFSRITAR